jgi:hypothetical protein
MTCCTRKSQKRWLIILLVTGNWQFLSNLYLKAYSIAAFHNQLRVEKSTLNSPVTFITSSKFYLFGKFMKQRVNMYRYKNVCKKVI